MARLEYVGVDGIMLEMQRLDKTLRPRIEKALTLAAGVMQEQLRLEARSFKAPTGELAGKVAPGKVWHHAERSNIDTWAQGSYFGRRGSERRAETVAFVLEYGRTGMAANPWHKRAMRKSKRRVNSIIAEVLAEN